MLEKTFANLKSWGSLRWVSARQGVFSNPSKIPSLSSLSLWSATTTMVHFSQILHKLLHTGPSKELNKNSHPDTAGTNNHQAAWMRFAMWSFTFDMLAIEGMVFGETADSPPSPGHPSACAFTCGTCGTFCPGLARRGHCGVLWRQKIARLESQP